MNYRRWEAIALLGAAACSSDVPESVGACPETQALVTNGLQLQGSELNGFFFNGVDLVGIDLEGGVRGATSEGEIVELHLSAAAPNASNPTVQLYTVRLPTGENLCGEGGTGLFVDGVWDNTGARHDTMDVGGLRLTTTFSCAAGAIAKCVLWGYEPWVRGAEAHQACTRMARADYCGDGKSHTRNGTVIDVYDRVIEPASEELMFEAGWDADGAVCVKHPRYRVIDDAGDEVLPWCWNGLPRCHSLPNAEEWGATLVNASNEGLIDQRCD